MVPNNFLSSSNTRQGSPHRCPGSDGGGGRITDHSRHRTVTRIWRIRSGAIGSWLKNFHRDQITIDLSIRIDRIRIFISQSNPDENFGPDINALFKKIFDAPGGVAPAAWASPGCDDAALPENSYAKDTEQVITGYRKRPRPHRGGLAQGGVPPSTDPIPTPCFPHKARPRSIRT